MAILIVLAGCANREILERTSLTTLLGYDLAEDDKLAATAVIRQINPDLESKVEVQSATEETNRGALMKIELKTSKKIGVGQLRVALFGEELAKKGLDDSIHALIMNPEVSNGIYLAVVEGKANSLIESKYKNITDIGQHIFQLIDHNIEQNHALSSTLHEVNRDNTTKLTNFSLPMLKKQGEFIEISGIALFNEGKMVGSLPSEDILYAKMIRNDFQDGTLELTLPSATLKMESTISEEDIQIAIDSIKSTRKFKLVDTAVPEFNLTIDIECLLQEIQSELRVSDMKEQKNLEKQINKKIESEIKRIIQYSQEIDSDIFRFGEQYRAQNRQAKNINERWHEMYPDMKVNVTVNAKVLRDGVFQ
ncbi:Ger(x)C family spore germination protein [Ureibacillus sinduriensis]|uniref:Spore gernimation protein GerC n=2 Tax=Ureibacillus sinduriensis TaxID=561440 RepID=A0A0A3I4D8_9BACL|nr:Ger(x)C family spore germination protein [Ureibacillus sinduriensis]KGR79671.1 spore gernimation protein GerC [Ureibacillus sinduriensis BLB-1 = JCM 15800]